VSNHRIENVFLLLTDFPPYKALPPAKPAHGGKPADPPAPPEGEAESEAVPAEPVKYQNANVDQRSANGSTPLYIAVFVHDYNICRVLLAANADTTVEDDQGEGKQPRVSAPDLAKQLADKARAQQVQREAAQQGKPQKARKVVNQTLEDTLKIDQLLHDDPPNKSLDDLKSELAPGLMPQMGEDEEEDEGDKGEVEAPKKKGAAKGADDAKSGDTEGKKKKSKKSSPELKLILDKLTALDQRVQRIESRITPGAGFAPAQAADTFRVGRCSNCGGAGATQCATCRREFCATCGAKPALHACSH
jgi:hypothetical protein